MNTPIARLTEAQLAALPLEVQASIRATYAALDEKKKAPEPTAKVAQGGGISVYGLGRMPTTLSKSQWQRLFTVIPKVQELINLPEDQFLRLQAEAKAKAAANPFRPK